MKSDIELESWRRQWQSQPQVPVDLVRRVERQTVYMRQYRLLEILVTVVMGGGTIVAAAIIRNPNVALLAVGTAIGIALAWRFALKHTRGLWAPSAATTAAYLDLSIRRCHWKVADARYDSIQAVLLTVFVCIVDYRILVDFGKWSSAKDALGLWVLCGILCVLLVSAFESRRKKAKAELEYFAKLQAELGEGPSDIPS
jgi:hypothetical protein